MRYNTESESSSGFGMVLVLMALCLGGTAVVLKTQPSPPTSRVYVPVSAEPVAAPLVVEERDYLSAGIDRAAR